MYNINGYIRNNINYNNILPHPFTTALKNWRKINNYNNFSSHIFTTATNTGEKLLVAINISHTHLQQKRIKEN